MTWPEILSAEPTLLHFESEALWACHDDIDWHTFLALHESDLQRLTRPLDGQPSLWSPTAYQVVLSRLACCWACGSTGPDLGNEAEHGEEDRIEVQQRGRA
jgi:hypothetical protein